MPRLFAAIALTLSMISVAHSTELEDALQSAFDAGELSGLHAVHARMGGEVIVDAYFPGTDENWGLPLPDAVHSPTTLHDLRSVTKSITSLLYGIALEQGVVPPVTEPLLAQFTDYSDLVGEAARDAVTIADALTMRMGMEWDETLPYSDPRNSEIAMENADDRLRFILDRPMVAEPGTVWTYSGGATAIIGALIEQGSGMPLDRFAKLHLFDPLGITEFEWNAGADDTVSAASGLRLTAPDLARIGQMISDGGTYQGQQIVAQSWLEQSMTKHTKTAGPLDYGYFWYMPPVAVQGATPPWTAGFGNGGQRFSINKGIDLVLVVYAGRYNDPDAWQLAVKVVEEHLAPAVRARLEN